MIRFGVSNREYRIWNSRLLLCIYWDLKLTGAIVESIPLHIFFGLDRTQWLFSAVPDSYSLAALSIIFLSSC